jgi:tetratricopeptide (TPR) repeat protein
MSEADQRELKFCNEKALEEGIQLVLTFSVLLGKIDVALDEHERAMHVRQRIYQHVKFNQDAFVNSLNQHALNIAQHTSDVGCITVFQKAVLDRYKDASEGTLASLSSNLACMLNATAMLAKSGGNADHMEQLLADAENYFYDALTMSGYSPAQVADFSGFYYHTGKYDKSLSVIAHLILTDDNKHDMNGYGTSERLCVDLYIREEIDNDTTGQGFLVNSHLYSAYIKVACLMSLGNSDQAEISASFQHMADLCSDDVISSHTAYRLLGYTYLRTNNTLGARVAFGTALELKPSDPFTHRCINEYL